MYVCEEDVGSRYSLLKSGGGKINIPFFGKVREYSCTIAHVDLVGVQCLDVCCVLETCPLGLYLCRKNGRIVSN